MYRNNLAIKKVESIFSPNIWYLLTVYPRWKMAAVIGNPGSSQPILFPTRVPPEVQALMKAANKMDKPLFRKMIKCE